MSAYLTSCDAISALASYWSRRSRSPQQDLTHLIARATAPKTHEQYCSAADTAARYVEHFLTPAHACFDLLLQANIESLKARYPESPEMWAEAEGYAYKPSRAVNYWIQSRTTGQLVGLVNGYAYQSCEHDSWESDAAYRLVDSIRHQLLKDMETRDCGENAGNWASWEETGDPMQEAWLAHVAQMQARNAI